MIQAYDELLKMLAVLDREGFIVVSIWIEKLSFSVRGREE